VLTGNWVRFPGGGDDVREPTPAWPLETVLDAAAHAGFAAVGLDHYTVGAFVDAGGRLVDVATMLRARGLVCTDVGVLRVGEDVVQSATDLAELASVVGASLCIAALYAPVSNERAARELRAAADILGDAGVRLAFEFTAYGHRRTLRDAIDICDAVDWRRCALLVDTWHVFRGGEEIRSLRSLTADQIALVHVNDGAALAGGDAMDEGRRHRLAPGDGAFPLEDFAEALDAIGYDGVVSVEVLSDELRRRAPQDAARVLHRSLAGSRWNALDGWRDP
jgi:4-hydroxyphenylpyruvate dioxygenase